MPVVHFTTTDGEELTVEAEPGLSVMEAAVDASVPGILADCGGGCACGTCHVRVSPEWMDKVGPRGDMEQELVESSDGYSDFSRLSCQIEMREELDGLEVTVVAS